MVQVGVTDAVVPGGPAKLGSLEIPGGQWGWELPVQPEIETLPGVLVSLEAAVGGMLHLTFSTEGTARL